MMFCKNCGNQMVDTAAVCVNCGVAAGQGTNYCQYCGAQLSPGAAFCTGCGSPAAVKAPSSFASGGQKSKLAAGLLGILLGAFGVHNFYLGYTSKAVAQLLITVLSCGILSIASGIWGLVEGIMILTGSIATDAKGLPLAD